MSATEDEILEKNVVAATTAWLEKMVIGLNLCPFAKAIHVKKQIRYALSLATDSDGLLSDLKNELGRLIAANPMDIESTLIIHPKVLTDFLEYNDFLAVCNGVLEEMELDGIVQIASFHPAYQFAGTKVGDVNELYESLTVPDTPFTTRGKRYASGRHISRGRGDLQGKHGHFAEDWKDAVGVDVC